MPYQQYTLSQLQAKLQARLGNSTFFVSAELTIYLNEAVTLWQLLTGFWKIGKPDITKTTIGTVFYSVPAGMLSAMRMEFNAQPMLQKSLAEMDKGSPGWQTDSASLASPKIADWFPFGLGTVGVHPSDYVTNNDLGFVGMANAPVLSAAGDYIDIGDEELKAILDCAVHLALFKIGGAEFQDSYRLFKGFIEAASQRNSLLKSTSLYRHWMGIDKQRAQRSLVPEKVGAR